jgi:hypothetical protein
MVGDSVEMVEVVPESLCVRCSTFHAEFHADNDDEGYFQASCRARRCGVLHSNYDLVAKILHDYEHFDCEIYIPDVEKIEMRGDTILVHENIMKKLDGQFKMKQDAKKDQYGYNSHSSDYLVHYLTCFGFLLLICCRKTSNCFGWQESFTRDLQWQPIFSL